MTLDLRSFSLTKRFGYLQSGCHITNSLPVTVGVRYDANFVSKGQQTLGKLIDVAFHASRVGVEEVGDHAKKTSSANVF